MTDEQIKLRESHADLVEALADMRAEVIEMLGPGHPVCVRSHAVITRARALMEEIDG